MAVVHTLTVQKEMILRNPRLENPRIIASMGPRREITTLKVDTALDEVWSLLHAAAYFGDTHVASILIQHGAKVNQSVSSRIPTRGRPDPAVEGKSPLWLAAGRGHHNMVKLLLSHGAKPEVVGGPTPCVSYKCNACLIRKNIVTKCSALHLAVAHGHRDVAKALIDAGANLEARVTSDRHRARSATYVTAIPTKILHMAVWSRSNFLQMILDLQHDVNAKNAHGQTALYIAIQIAIAQRDADEPRLPKTTETYDIRVFNDLIAKGANVSARDKDGLTPLHNGMMGSVEHRSISFTSQLEIVKILLAKGADPNARELKSHSTPLHYAAMFRNVKILELLVVNGGNLMAKDDEGRDVRTRFLEAISGQPDMDDKIQEFEKLFEVGRPILRAMLRHGRPQKLSSSTDF